MGLFKAKTAFRPPVFYVSISEIPLKNWEQFHKTGLAKWLIADMGDADKGYLIQADDVQQAYFKLHDQYTAVNGVDNKLIEWQQLILLQLECIQLYVDGDKSQENWITHYDNAITDLMKKGGESDMIESRLIYSQAFGQPVDPEKTSLETFAVMVKLVRKQAKQKQSNGRD